MDSVSSFNYALSLRIVGDFSDVFDFLFVKKCFIGFTNVDRDIASFDDLGDAHDRERRQEETV